MVCVCKCVLLKKCPQFRGVLTERFQCTYILCMWAKCPQFRGVLIVYAMYVGKVSEFDSHLQMTPASSA